MNRDRPILVTGPHGQVGTELMRALAPLGEVVGVARDHMDLTQPDSIRQCLEDIRPGLVVNAAAYTAVDRAESEADLAFAVNAEAVGVLGEAAARLGAPVVHYSTDYVFAGTGAHFQPEDQATDPVNVYGRSKLAGEQALLAANSRSWVLRTSWVFGAVGQNFLKTMLRLWRNRDELSVVDDQFGAPTSAALIADVTALLVYRMHLQTAPEAGIYHLAAAGVTTWHAYARHVIACASAQGMRGRFGEDAILPVPTSAYPTPAQRPANSRLDCSKLEAALGIQLPPWEQGAAQVVTQLIAGVL